MTQVRRIPISKTIIAAYDENDIGTLASGALKGELICAAMAHRDSRLEISALSAKVKWGASAALQPNLRIAMRIGEALWSWDIEPDAAASAGGWLYREDPATTGSLSPWSLFESDPNNPDQIRVNQDAYVASGIKMRIKNTGLASTYTDALRGGGPDTFSKNLYVPAGAGIYFGGIGGATNFEPIIVFQLNGCLVELN